MTTEEIRNLFNAAIIERKLQSRAKSNDLRQAYDKVNDSITEKKQDLTERLNDLTATEDHLKDYELHNHYY